MCDIGQSTQTRCWCRSVEALCLLTSTGLGIPAILSSSTKDKAILLRALPAAALVFLQFADVTMHGYYNQDVQRAAAAASLRGNTHNKDVAPAAVHAAAAAANMAFRKVSLMVSHE